MEEALDLSFDILLMTMMMMMSSVIPRIKYSKGFIFRDNIFDVARMYENINITVFWVGTSSRKKHKFFT